MKNRSIIFAVAGLCILCSSASAQSPSFKLGKWTEIHNAILKELNRSYVDSLPVDRIERAGIDAMLGSLDPYTIYIPEEENEDVELILNKTYGGVGAIIYKPDIDGNVIINEPYEGSPAAKAGLQCGDEVMEIDGVTVHGLKTEECSSKMKGKPGTELSLKVLKLRSGKEEDIKIIRERIHLPDIEYSGMLDDSTGYIRQGGFTDKVSNELRQEIENLKAQGMKRLFYDLRGNGGGLLKEAIEIVSLFVPRGSVVVTVKGSEGGDIVHKTNSEPVDTLLPLYVLVDSGSASASEIVSGALQDYDRATILGKRTYGKGLVQSMRQLPYNGTMKVTTAKYYIPSGRCVQAIDYAHRNEDGSVGHIPDSLTSEFKTAHGRIVRDGGGVTPDKEIANHEYSRLTYSLVVSGVVERYTLKYVREHKSIPALPDFHYTDEDYEDFVTFATGEKFDCRSSALTYFDSMVKELEKDGMAENVKAELDALKKGMETDKESFLRLKKSEIIPFIEEEIAVRYYYQKAGAEIALRYDDQLRKALEIAE